MIRTLREYEGCTATLCVDSYTQGVPRGFLFHSFLGPVPFGSLTDLLVRMETILEESGAPQSYMVPRRFEDVLPVRLPELSSPRIHRGNLATFSRYPDGINSALLIIDLDDFKLVNDRYGHLFGDSVLTQAAREIRRLFRNQDIVARIGGDEFMVVVRGMSHRQMLEQRCRQLIETFRDVFRNHHYQLPLSCSIGVALAPESGKTYYELFRNADLALYRAKARGKNRYEIHSGEMEQPLTDGRTLSAVNNVIDSDREPGLAEESLVRHAFRKLYSAENLETAVREVLSDIGKKMNVSRVYVFENSEDNRFCSNTYEWCNEGIHPEIDMLQNISYETDIPGYEENFDEEGIFYCPDISILTGRAHAIVEAQGIKSMLQCAIRENGVFRGYIGFDECVEQRFWTRDQIRMLIWFSEALSMFLLRERRQQKLAQQADGLRSILESSEIDTGIVPPATDRFLTLSSCYGSRGDRRWVVHAHLPMELTEITDRTS